jgi:hypothetical protein
MALVVILSAVVAVGVGRPAEGAGARAAAKTDASGTASCTMAKGKLVISPPLSFSGTASSATFTFTAKLTCTGTSGVTGGTLSATGTSASNNCTPLATTGLPALTATIDWKGKFNPSTIVFSDGNFAIGSGITITAPSTGPNPAAGTSTVTGSFAYEPAQATFVSDQLLSTFLSGCSSTTGGLTGFTFTGVNGPSKLEISQQQTVPPPPPPASTPVTVGVDASSPGAAVDQGLIGLNHIVSGSAPALQAIGATWGRTDAALEFGAGTSQAAYNCTTGAFDPTYLDGNIALNKAAGVQTELIVDYFPPCIGNRASATDRAKWKKLVYAMALHEITAEGVRVFEVDNEPNFHGLTLKGSAGYLVLYRDTAEELEAAAKAAGVSIEVGGPAVDEVGQIDNSWISALAAYAVAQNLPLDFVAWHQYPNDPDEGPQAILPNGICDTGAPQGGQPCWYNPNLDVTLYQRGAAAVRSVLAQYPSLHPLLWVDEWGVDSGNDARLDGPYGAAFVAAALDSAQQGGIDRMSFYDTADNPNDPYDNFGLLYGNLTPKPVYTAFSYWHQLSGSLLPVTFDPDQSGSGPVGQIGAVASAGAGGTIHVMVYDFAPYDSSGVYGTTDPTPFDHQVTVDLSGLPAASYSLTQSLVDGGHDGSTVATSSVSGGSASTVFTLSGEGVTLLTLTPSS